MILQGECILRIYQTAEMVEVTENSCRDISMEFANGLSIICEKLEIDIGELIANFNGRLPNNIWSQDT
jgi:UDP-N-acetyl-D-mannosaminuronic acid dehydrogenase